MNVNVASNSHPTAAADVATHPYQSYDSLVPVPIPVPLTVDTTTPARRVIIIHKKGGIKLDPAVYLADHLYQAFLMYNFKLVLCECFGDHEPALGHVLQHFIYAWCTAMNVMFIRHDEFLNQYVQVSPSDVAQATKLWLADFEKYNAIDSKIQSGKAQLPRAGMEAASGTPPLMVSPPDGKRHYGSPLHFEGQEDQAVSNGQSSSLLVSPTSVAETSLETLDKDASLELDFSDEDEYIEYLLMDNAMPLLEMASENSADSTDDEFLNSMESY